LKNKLQRFLNNDVQFTQGARASIVVVILDRSLKPSPHNFKMKTRKGDKGE
jgi:hypothetical protein